MSAIVRMSNIFKSHERSNMRFPRIETSLRIYSLLSMPRYKVCMSDVNMLEVYYQIKEFFIALVISHCIDNVFIQQ